MLMKIIIFFPLFLIIKFSTFSLCIQNYKSSNDENSSHHNIDRTSVNNFKPYVSNQIKFDSNIEYDSTTLNRGEYYQSNNDINYQQQNQNNPNILFDSKLNRQDTTSNYYPSTNVVHNNYFPNRYAQNYNRLQHYNIGTRPYNVNVKPTPPQLPPSSPSDDDIIYGQNYFQQNTLQNQPSSLSVPVPSINDQQFNNYIQPSVYSPFTNFLASFGNSNLPLSTQFSKALYGITNNDDLQCVPKLICQMTGDPNRRSELPGLFTTPYLTTLISALPTTSPLIMLTKAAALGLTGGDDSCHTTYSRCPKDETELLYYLNNYRGGFFKFFAENDSHSTNDNFHDNRYEQNNQQNENSDNSNSGPFSAITSGFQTTSNVIQFITKFFKKLFIGPPNTYYRNTNNFHNYPYNRKFKINQKNVKNTKQADPIEGRILNNRPPYSKYMRKVTFPVTESNNYYNSPSYPKLYSNDQYRTDRYGKRVKFLNENSNYNGNYNYDNDKENFKKPQMIFPDRTGTGSLRFDTENFHSTTEENYRKNYGKIINRPNQYEQNYYNIHNSNTKAQTENYYRPALNSDKYENDDENIYVTNARGEVEYYIKPNGMKVFL